MINLIVEIDKKEYEEWKEGLFAHKFCNTEEEAKNFILNSIFEDELYEDTNLIIKESNNG